jgi:hypothetical protein
VGVPCESRSTTSTRRPARWSPQANATEVAVFPDPPFGIATTSLRAVMSISSAGANGAGGLTLTVWRVTYNRPAAHLLGRIRVTVRGDRQDGVEVKHDELRSHRAVARRERRRGGRGARGARRTQQARVPPAPRGVRRGRLGGAADRRRGRARARAGASSGVHANDAAAGLAHRSRRAPQGRARPVRRRGRRRNGRHRPAAAHRGRCRGAARDRPAPDPPRDGTAPRLFVATNMVSPPRRADRTPTAGLSSPPHAPRTALGRSR